MLIFHLRIHRCCLLAIFFLFSLNILNGQTIELSEYYKKQVNKKEFSIHEKEFLVDSLLKENNIRIDTLELVKIYRNFVVGIAFSDIKKSIAYTEKIEELAIVLNDFNNENFKKNHKNRIIFLDEDQQFYKGLEAIDSYFKRYPNEDKDQGKVYRIAGNIYSELGDFTKALDNYNKSIYLLQLFESNKELTRTYVEKLKTLVSLEESTFSKDILELKDEIDALREVYVIGNENEIAINLNLGFFYDFQKEYNEAQNIFSKALALSIEDQDTIHIYKSYINLAVVSKKENNIQHAKEMLQKASEYTLADNLKVATISNNLADLYKIENNHEQALIHYQNAITKALQSEEIAYQKLPAFQAIKLSPNKLDVLGYLIDKANAWIAYYNAEKKPEYLENALETFTLADRLIDIIYVESREDLSKLFWRKKSASFYPNAVEVCYRLQQPERAFFFMEKNKAILLLENMTNAAAKRLSKLPEHILIRELDLMKKIKSLESEIQEFVHKDEKNIDVLKDNVFKYKKEYTAFIDSLETEFPKYYMYKKNINIVTLKEVQKQLKNDELILQYIVGKEKGFVTLVSSKNIEISELPATKQLNEIVATYKEAVSKPFVNTEDKNTYTEVAKKLYKQLIPFENSEARLAQKRIIIIADGILQYIPFEALLTSQDEYLIKSMVVHYNFSLSSAVQSQQNTANISENFIAIAPTKFKNNQFGTLETSSAELKRLSTIFNANHFQYEEATKERFIKAYGNYKIVHLSTHGGIHNTIPWMAFYDEKMTLDELYFTKNQSELVVLSACKTSDGELRKGEGVMSLARGFFNAGAKSVVSSLWDINEKASNDIIQEFYKNIVNGDTKSEALQKAKLTYIQQNENTSEASPYYWSGLTITGDIYPIKNIQKHNYMYYGFASIFLILIGVSIRKKRQKRKTA